MTRAPLSPEALRDRIQGLSSRSIGKPTLVYFDIIGIAWPIRCLLHLGDIEHDLIQISLRDWSYRDASGQAIVKRSFRNGHVPRYVDTMVDLNDSRLIMDYLAEQVGLLPADRAGRFRAVEIIGHGYDALFGLTGMLPIIARPGIPDEYVRMRTEAYMGRGRFGLVTNGYHVNLQVYRDYLLANGNGEGFLVGDTLSVVDLHAFNVLCNWYKAFDRDAFAEGYPELDAYIRRVASAPGVRDYIDRLQEPTTWFAWPDGAVRLCSPAELRGLV